MIIILSSPPLPNTKCEEGIIFVEKSMSVCVSDNSKTTDRIYMKFGLKVYQRCRMIEFEYGTNPKSRVAINLQKSALMVDP